jgi:uncharacterized protein YdhG (YjbR/CyaY superfamily)
MPTKPAAPQTIDDYIANYPENIQALLKKMRETIKKAAPDATETINYGIPTFTLAGRNLVHFGAAKKHIGFYPTPSGIEKFQKELSKYEGAKGSVQFPLDQPIPYALIAKITKFRVKEMADKAKKK